MPGDERGWLPIIILLLLQLPIHHHYPSRSDAKSDRSQLVSNKTAAQING